MGLFSRKSDSSPEAVEYRAAKKALANDPVNTGRLGTVDINSPAVQQNLRAQERLTRAEAAHKGKRRR